MNARISTPALLATLLGVASTAVAHDPGRDTPRTGEKKATILEQRTLPDAPGKFALVRTIEYAPGQYSVPHVHGGSVVAYVLEGGVISQIDGEPPVTYRAGQSWYEKPGAGHLVSRNASNTKPARLVAWILNDGDKAVFTPLPSTADAKASP